MSAQGKPLGVLTPVGGGDPVPLYKTELTVGRRKSCDVCLDFENVSGKHCVLRFINGVWHARDLASSNGTTINGLKLSAEHHILPDDQLGVASHYFRIDYEPTGHSRLRESNKVLASEEDIVETRQRKSLMELAGFEDDDRARSKPQPAVPRRHQPIERLSVDEAEFDDAIPEDFAAKSPNQTATPVADEDFFKLITEEIQDD